MLIIAVIFLGIGIFMLANELPNYNKIKHAQAATLEDVQNDKMGSIVKIQAKTGSTDVVTTAGGKQVAYERIKVTHEEGSGKHKTTRTDLDARYPEKLTLTDDKGGTMTLPTTAVADEYMEKLGPWKPSNERFEKELKPMLIPQFAKAGDQKGSLFNERENVLMYLPANTPVIVIGERSDAIAGSPVGPLASGFFKTGVIVTTKSVDAVLGEMQTSMAIMSIFLVLGVVFLLIAGFMFYRRMM